MLIIALISFLAFVIGLMLIALLILGYREQVRVTTEAANRNAGYWAESESKLYDAVVELAKQEVLAHAEGKRADELSRIARSALQIAHHKEFGQRWGDVTQTPLADIQRFRSLTECQHEGFHDDPDCPLTDVLDAKEIG